MEEKFNQLPDECKKLVLDLFENDFKGILEWKSAVDNAKAALMIETDGNHVETTVRKYRRLALKLSYISSDIDEVMNFESDKKLYGAK
jgi:hypothetical protein